MRGYDGRIRSVRASQWHFGAVAGRTVARLMADLPEIGACNGTAIATLVGLAAMANDSARRKGCRIHRWWTLARSVPSCSSSPEERPASMMDSRNSTKG